MLLSILRGEEHGAVLSEDLLGPVAQYPLRARVPVDDIAGSIKHNDRIVPDALHHQAEAILAFPQGLLGLLTLTDLLLRLLTRAPLRIIKVRPLQRQAAYAGDGLHKLALFGIKGTLCRKAQPDGAQNALVEQRQDDYRAATAP